ncbi:hypothetical protein V500_02964 [Pseudogymnoascus sp. VKM F-4518 (FW-2643)]|nr:hypothetical protein V500_02964 [Pseudogymnoascus sp. VKM F-4518 (FW-2643)]
MQAPSSRESEPSLHSTETSPAQRTSTPTEPRNSPSITQNYPQKRYTDIATALGVIGTFGGGFSFTTLFTITCPDDLVRRLLEFAAVLFIGSLSACIPVFCAVHGTDEKEGLRTPTIKDFVRCHLLIAGILLLSALLLITGLAILSSVVGIHLSDTDNKAADAVRHRIPREDEERWKRVLNSILFGVLPILIILLLGLVCAFDPAIKGSSHSRCPTTDPCPTNLNGPYKFPHLIIPIDSSKPDTAPGTSYFGTVSSTVSSIFNFDIPAADSGKKCSLVFLFPTQAELETSSFTISGNGGLDFSKLSGTATGSTTFNNAPNVQTDYGVTIVSPGHSYNIATFDCPAGTAISFEIKASGDTWFNYFQDYNQSPIGLYITTC